MPRQKSKFRFKLPRRLIIPAALILGAIGLLYFFKNQFVVGWVNGRPLWRISYVRELEKLAKNQAFDSLMTKQLILAEARKQKVSVDQNKVNDAMTSIDNRAKEQGSNLEELLAAQGISRAAVEDEVRLQKILENLVGEAEISDEEVNTYWEENKTLYAGQNFDEVKDDIREQLKQQAMIGKIQELITRLQSEAKIVKW